MGKDVYKRQIYILAVRDYSVVIILPCMMFLLGMYFSIKNIYDNIFLFSFLLCYITNNEEQSRFSVSQRIQFQLIVGCNLAQLRNIKYGQTRTAGNQNRLSGFARDKLSRTFSSNSKKIRCV